MSIKELETNAVTVVGTVAGAFTYDHEIYGEKFYRVELQVERKSHYVDTLPVMVSERLMDVTEDLTGKILAVMGNLRSFNREVDSKKRLLVFVFARQAEVLEENVSTHENNNVFLDGYICKEPIHRKTPLGKEITDLLIAVNRPYGKSDYIPCVVWGRNAAYVSSFGVGTNIQLYGRLQSREYTKYLDKEKFEVRTAYELSVSKLNV